MCGRYYVNEEAWARMREDFRELPEVNPFMHFGDVTPAMPAVSLTAAQPGVDAVAAVAVTPLTWGFPGFDKNKLIINARAKGIEKKPTFAESLLTRRCVLPASGFYEWDRSKEKVTFTLTDEPVIYLAGIYRPYGQENRFVIITREANESMLPVHDRMPLMIRPRDVRDWLHDADRMRDILQEPLPRLLAKCDYEQLSLF